MKKTLTLAAVLLMSPMAHSQSEPAGVIHWDVWFYSFKNYCTGEYVRPFPGQTIVAVLRLDEGDNSIHFINRANGHVDGWGVQSLDSYRMTIQQSFVPNQPVIGNVVDGNGTITFNHRVTISSADNPSAGVSHSNQTVHVVIREGIGEVVHFEPFGGECGARPM